MTTAMAPVVDNSSHYQAEQVVTHNPMQQPQANAVALDDSYADESYDYGQYGDGGYDDGSGMIDPNTGMPMQGAGADGNKAATQFHEVNSFEDLDNTIKTMFYKIEAGFQCTECEHVSKQRPNMVNHVEAKHVQHNGVVCELCNKHSTTRQAHRMHQHRAHGVQPSK